MTRDGWYAISFKDGTAQHMHATGVEVRDGFLVMLHSGWPETLYPLANVAYVTTPVAEYSTQDEQHLPDVTPEQREAFLAPVLTKVHAEEDAAWKRFRLEWGGSVAWHAGADEMHPGFARDCPTCRPANAT